ncbi:MAG: tyrosine-type recombinase/integrase [Sphingomonadales bacterium]|nr:tyrosine-type recombinase/integrase [Sphingomonadales bacterium]
MALSLRKRPGRAFTIRGTVHIWRKGQRVSIPVPEQSTGTSDRGEAEAIKSRTEAQIREENLTGRRPVPTFGEWLANYIEATGQERFLERILDHYEFLPADEVTDERILEDGSRLFPGRKPATIRRNWDTPIRAIINHNTKPKRRQVEDTRRTYFFTPAQAESLILAYDTGRYKNDHWARAHLTFLLGQGVRVGESLAIDTATDVFLDYRYVIVRNPKNGAQYRLNLIPRVTAALSRLPNLGEPGPLFRRFDGRPFTDRHNRGGQIRNRFARAVEEIGLDPLLYTPHVCRHTWATWFYSQTRDPLALKAAGGWKSREYERYIHLASDTLGDEARAHNWAFSGTSAVETATAETN